MLTTDDDGRTTDACLYYKLTFGSGELKIYWWRCHDYQIIDIKTTVKFLKFQTPEKFAEITLQFEHNGFSIE